MIADIIRSVLFTEGVTGVKNQWPGCIEAQLPSAAPILALGVVLLVIFGAWIAAAHAIYVASFGDQLLTSPLSFAHRVRTTPEGMKLIILGNGIGFLFALLAASISVVSFPLLLDRDVGIGMAMVTSIRVVMQNPTTMAMWFIMVATGLLFGSLPMLVGLAVVLPLFGHATWHLYRRAVEPDDRPRPEYHPKHKRYAADFPASLFASSSEVDEQPSGTDQRSS